MTDRNAKHANVQALMTTILVTIISVIVVAILVFIGGGTATVEYVKENLTVFLGGSFALFTVIFLVIFNAWSKALKLFLTVGAIAAETVRNPTQPSEPKEVSAQISEAHPEVAEGAAISIDPVFKITFLALNFVAIVTLIISVAVAFYGDVPNSEWQKSLYEISVQVFKLAFGVLVGMLLGKAL